MKIKQLALLAFLLFFSFNASAALDVSNIKIEMAKLEVSQDKKDGQEKAEELLAKINEQEKGSEASAEFYTWKGIVVAKMAYYKKSLSLAKEAKGYLEKAVSIDEKNSNAAALNALGILYHRVPKFISFGDKKKSEEYFKRANNVSSNLDTNWRYGEFLVETDRKAQGLELLKKALLKVDEKKPDEKIKEKIISNLIKKYESQ